MELDRNALVWGIVGNLGGGKSMTAVHIGVSCMVQHYYVASNITFNLDEICRFFQDESLRHYYQHIDLDDPTFDPFALPTGSPRGTPLAHRKRVVVILDEVAEWFDQYANAKSPLVSRLWSWLRHSSKRSQDVIIVCQRQEYINKVVRSLIARWVWVDDLAVYRIPWIRMRLPFCGGAVMANTFDRQGNKIAGVEFLPKSTWGRFYDTSECLNATGAAVNDQYQDVAYAIKLRRGLLDWWLFSVLVILWLCWTGCAPFAPSCVGVARAVGARW